MFRHFPFSRAPRYISCLNVNYRNDRATLFIFHKKFKSTSTAALNETDSTRSKESLEIKRLKHLRNVGILAHVDAGKTTVTERMLALAGVVRNAGNVDDGNTVTDYLPAERERGITIQSAAISFDWGWHNNRRGNDYEQNDKVRIQLIDTPGHVDFSVEVNRSVAVLDGAVLVVDAVAGVQPQTQTVWRALKKPSLNNHENFQDLIPKSKQEHAHEPLPCVAVINKMDKDGSNFGKAVQSLKKKLPGAFPIATQIPLFRRQKVNKSLDGENTLSSVIAVSQHEPGSETGEFCGIADLVHMRAIIWPDVNPSIANVDNCVPSIINLVKSDSQDPIHTDCQVTEEAIRSRADFIEALAEVDETMEGKP